MTDLNNLKDVTITELLLGFIIGAFTFVTGLAWRDAIQAIFKKYLEEGNTVGANLVYAVVVTGVSLAIITLLLNVFLKNKKVKN